MSENTYVDAVTPAISIQLVNFSADDPGRWEGLMNLVRACDAAEVDRIVVSDHVVFGENLEAYAQPELGGIKGGVQPTGPDGHWLEPLTLLSVVAGMTRHCRLQTGILIAALRRPVTLAKAASTLDVLSGGRLDLGVGVGWQREEYDAAGLAYEGRGKLLDHTLDVCQTFWREQRAGHQSDRLSFDGIHMMPKPLQPDGVPLWVSGTLNQNVLNRIVRFGSGWIPWGDDAADPAVGLVKVKEALDAAGRSTDGFQCTTGLRRVKNADGSLDLDAMMDAAPAQVEAGITDFRVQLPVPQEQAAATDYLSNVVARFRKAVGR